MHFFLGMSFCYEEAVHKYLFSWAIIIHVFLQNNLS